jgi:DNA topoisomerase VI subunit B
VAHYPDILKEIQLAAQECGRKLATFIRKRKALDYQAQRRSIFELYIEEVAVAIGKITGRKPGPIKREFLQVAHTGAHPAWLGDRTRVDKSLRLRTNPQLWITLCVFEPVTLPASSRQHPLFSRAQS